MKPMLRVFLELSDKFASLSLEPPVIELQSGEDGDRFLHEVAQENSLCMSKPHEHERDELGKLWCWCLLCGIKVRWPLVVKLKVDRAVA